MSEPYESASTPDHGELLPVWQRLTFATVGAAGIGGGSAATFITRNSVGSGVMLAIGALLFVIGVLGNPISRLKIGENEVQLVVRRMARATFNSPDDAAKEEVAQVIVDSFPPTAPVRREAEGVLQGYELYERAVMSAMLKVGSQAMFKPEHDQRFDAVFRYRDKTVALNAKAYTSNVGVKRVLTEMLTILQNPSWSRDLFGMVLVVPRAAEFEIVDGTVSGEWRLRMVRWDSDSDNDALHATLDAIVDEG